MRAMGMTGMRSILRMGQVRWNSSTIPRSLSELEAQAGKLTYRNGSRELANYLLINRLMLIHTVRSALYSKPFVQQDKTLYLPLINESKYFNYRTYFYLHYTGVELNRLENFPNHFNDVTENNTTYSTEELSQIFEKYPEDLDFTALQNLIILVVRYLVSSRQRPTYELYSLLIEEFNKRDLLTVSNQVYQAITRLPKEYLNFLSNTNYLCPVNEGLLVTMLSFIKKLHYRRDFETLLQLVDVNSNLVLSVKESTSMLNPLTDQRVSKVVFPKRSKVNVLKAQFFDRLLDTKLYLKDSSRSLKYYTMKSMSFDTLFLYLEASYILGNHNAFHLLLRKLIFKSVITENRELRTFIVGDFPFDAMAITNIQTVEDFALLFNKRLLKLVLKYCYTSKDALCFSWILAVIKRVYIVDYKLYLKYVYPLGVIDNQLISLIWLNCKNLDYQVYETWVLLEKIFKMEDIVGDYSREKFILMSCK